MDNRKKAVVYPYSAEFSPVVRHKNLIKEYEITSLVSPRGWNLHGYDASIGDKGTDIGMIVSSEYEAALCECDALVVADCQATDSFRKTIYEKINMAIDNKKDIICTLPLEEEHISLFESKCSNRGVNFAYCCQNQEECLETTHNELEDIDVPVVFVAGTFEKTQKFELQLSLRENLIHQGYRVSQIGTRSYCELMGFHSFPDFMHDSGVSEVNKVIRFNNLLKKIERTEKPDIIIIGIPGAILPYNKDLREEFGITAFLISHAVQPDFVVLSVLYEEYPLEYFPRLFNILKCRFGFGIDILNISNTRLDLLTTREYGKKCFEFLDRGFVEKKKSVVLADDIPVLNILNVHDNSKISDKLLETLSCGSSLV